MFVEVFLPFCYPVIHSGVTGGGAILGQQGGRWVFQSQFLILRKDIVRLLFSVSLVSERTLNFCENLPSLFNRIYVSSDAFCLRAVFLVTLC